MNEESNSFYMFRHVAITLGFAIAIVCVIFVSKCHQEPDYHPAIIDRLKKDLADRDRDISLLENTRKILELRVIESEKVATRAQDEAAGLKLHRKVLKEKKPSSERDSLVKYIRLDLNCDSLISKLETADSALTVANKQLHMKDSVNDKIISNLEIKVRDITEMDSTHVSLLKEAIKHRSWDKVKMWLIAIGGLLIGLWL